MKIKTFAVERWMDTYETQCTVNIAESCVESLSIDELLHLCADDFGEAVYRVQKQAFLEKLMEIPLTYGAIEGSDALKKGICSLYASVTPERVTVAHGAIGANYLVLMSLLEPGDEMVTLLPTYQQHYSVPETLGVTVHKLHLKAEDGFALDLEALEQLVTPETKLISFPNPNNPTGALVTTETLEAVAAIAARVGAYVFVDEAYRGLRYEGPSFTPSIVDLYDKGISTGSLSKTFALAGLRMGWVCAPRAVIEKVNAYRDYNHISCSRVDDYIATWALSHKETIVARSLKQIRRNLALVEKWVVAHPGFQFVVPKAGSVIVIQYDLDMPSETFCRRLLEQEGVLTIPGSRLDIEGHFRVGIGNNTDVLKEGLHRIGRFYDALSREGEQSDAPL